MLKMRKLKLSRLKKYPTSISLFVACLCIVLIFLFQNCADYLINEDSQSSSSSSSSSSNNDLSSSSSQMSIRSKTIIDISTLIAYYSSQPYVVRDQLPEQTDVTINFVYIYPLSAKFRWSVKRGFQTVVNGKKSSIPFFGPYQFAKKGAYDIFANTYGKKSTLLTKASKRLIIGEECDIHRIIEFELTDGSLTTGQSVTFELEEPDAFDNITWKTSLNTDAVESESLTIDEIPDNVSHLYIGVSAEEESESTCLTYRQKVFQINKNLTPHTNTFRPFDKVYRTTTITLENNWIYKYRNPAYGSDPQDFFINVEHADTCQLKINDDDTDTIDCDTQEAFFPDPKSTDLDLCQEDILTLTAKRDDNKKSIYQKYYRFCPARGSASCLALCYFGPLNQRPFHHTCLFESLYGRDCMGICYGNLCGVGPGGSGCGGPRRIVGWAGTCTGDPGGGASTTSGDDPGGGAAPSPPSDPGSGAAPSPPSDPGSGAEPSPPSDPGGGSEPEPPSDPGGGYEPEPVDAQCGDDCGECDEGYCSGCQSTWSPGETCTWRCLSSYGADDDCEAVATPTDAVCDNERFCGDCKVGDGPNHVSRDENGLCTWTCRGLHGGKNDETCSNQLPPRDGRCNNYRSGSCYTSSAAINRSSDGTTWECPGRYGGETDNCTLDTSTDGVCGNESRYSGDCLSGEMENYNSSGGGSGIPTWTCKGTANEDRCTYDPPDPPPTTQPPVTQPPVTQPPVTQPPQPACSSPGPGCDSGSLNCTNNTNQHGDITGQSCSCTLGGNTVSCGTFSSD